MGKRIIEVPLDGEQVVLVEVDDEDFYRREALARVADVDEMLARAGGSVRSAMDNVIMPTMHTIFDRVTEGRRAPDSVKVEFGLKLAGTLGAVFLPRRRRDTSGERTWDRRPPEPSPARRAPTSAPAH